jgi:hypothetical protein
VLTQGRKDFDYFGEAEITQVQVEVEPGSGSSDTIEFAMITIGFRRPGEQTEHRGRILLATDHAVFGLRYVCSGLFLYSEYE